MAAVIERCGTILSSHTCQRPAETLWVKLYHPEWWRPTLDFSSHDCLDRRDVPPPTRASYGDCVGEFVKSIFKVPGDRSV